jgi:hypothetical protein
MRLHEIITELFSRDFEPHPDNHWQPLGGGYRFFVGERQYEVNLKDMPSIGAPIQRVEFAMRTENGLLSWDITKTGNSGLVLELVAYSLRDEYNSTDVKGFFFTAKEPSRQKLYGVLARKLADTVGWDLRPDLAEWINYSKEKPYLIVEQDFAKRLDKARREEDDAAKQPQLD